jgi:hypothetical protein
LKPLFAGSKLADDTPISMSEASLATCLMLQVRKDSTPVGPSTKGFSDAMLGLFQFKEITEDDAVKPDFDWQGLFHFVDQVSPTSKKYTNM